MVYSSDFYTSRRPAYYKPSTSYSISTPRYSTTPRSYPVSSSVPEVRRQQYEYVVEQRSTTNGGPGSRSYTTTTERVERNSGPGGLTIERSSRSSDGGPGGYHSSYSSTTSGGRPGTYRHFSYNPIYSSDGYEIPPSYYKAHQVYQTSPFIMTPITSTAKPSSNVLPYNYRYRPTSVPHYHYRNGAAIHGVLDKIEHKHRSHPGYDATDEYLNTKSATNFDDVTRSIRAQTAGLLKQIYAPTIRPKSYSQYNTHTGYMELPIAERIESDAYIEAILRDSQNHHYDTIGKGHLACVTYAGGKAIPRRRPRLSGDAEVDNNIIMLSYYNKTREAVAASSDRPKGKVDTPAKTYNQHTDETRKTVQFEDKKSSKTENDKRAAEEVACKKEERLTEEARKEEEEEKEKLFAEEEARKAEEERLDAERKARKEEEERLAAEKKARKEEEKRLAAEEARKEEEERLAAEKARKIEEERLAAAEKARKVEEERLAAEKARKIEEERLAAEDEARKKEDERLAAEDEARRVEEERLILEKSMAVTENVSEEETDEEVEEDTKIVTTNVRNHLGSSLANQNSDASTEHHEESYSTLEEVDGGTVSTTVFRRATRTTTTTSSTVVHSGKENDESSGVEIEEVVENEEVSGDEHAVADGQECEDLESSDDEEEIKTEGGETKTEEEYFEEEDDDEEEEEEEEE